MVVKGVHGKHLFCQVFLGSLSIDGIIKVYFWDLDGDCSFFTVGVLHLGTKHLTEVPLHVRVYVYVCACTIGHSIVYLQF